jgi:hypothetical protein
MASIGGSIEEFIENVGLAVERAGYQDPALVATTTKDVIFSSGDLCYKAVLLWNDSGRPTLGDVKPLSEETKKLGEEVKLVKDNVEVVTRIMSSIKSSAPWTQYYQTNESRIRDYLRDDLLDLDSNRLRPKYQAICDEGIPEVYASWWGKQIRGSLSSAVKRLKDLYDGVAGLTAEFEENYSIKPFMSVERDTVIQAVTKFGHDYLNNVEEVIESFDELGLDDEGDNQQVSSKAIGKLHDEFVNWLYSAEVVGRLISKLVKKPISVDIRFLR